MRLRRHAALCYIDAPPSAPQVHLDQTFRSQSWQLGAMLQVRGVTSIPTDELKYILQMSGAWGGGGGGGWQGGGGRVLGGRLSFQREPWHGLGAARLSS